jgi:hypothetical protein
MKDPTQPSRIEPRWPAALAILAVLILLTVLPGRVRLLPAWVPWVLVTAVLLPMAGVALAARRARWLRVERAITLLFSLLYWRMDRGGPEARANDAGTKPDWLFPQSEAPEDAPSGCGRRWSTTCSSPTRRQRRSAPPTPCR